MRVAKSDLLGGIEGIAHGFFHPGPERPPEWNLSFKNGSPERVFRARVRACGLIGVDPLSLTHVCQEHGDRIWAVDSSHRGAGAADGTGQVGYGDGLITREPGVSLAILIADCLPVFACALDGSAAGIAHAGWRGTLDGIAVRLIGRLGDEYGVPPSDLAAWIGPGISREAFEVGPEVVERFESRWPGNGDCIDRDGSLRIDLKELNRRQLLSAGLAPERIEVSPHCTHRNPEMFSYRRDGAGMGHNMAVIAIRPR